MSWWPPSLMTLAYACLNVEQSKTNSSVICSSPYGTGDLAVIHTCRRPWRILVSFHCFVFIILIIHKIVTSESLPCFDHLAQLITPIPEHFLEHFVQALAKEELFSFYRMSLVLCVLYRERDSSAFTQWDHIMPGDLCNLCYNCAAWPHRPIMVHKPQLGSIVLGCSYEQLPRKEMKYRGRGKQKISGSSFYNPHSQMAPPSSPKFFTLSKVNQSREFIQ